MDRRDEERRGSEHESDQGSEQRIAGGSIEPPQPLRLRRRQPKSWHFDVFALDSPKYVVKRLIRC